MNVVLVVLMTLVVLAAAAVAAPMIVREWQAQAVSDREWDAWQALQRISAMERQLGLTPCVLWRTDCYLSECRHARAEREDWEARVMRGEAP